MTDYIFARQNGRDIPKEDKIFGITAAARKMMAERGKDSIILATIGSLLNDEGELIVLSSVVDVLHTLNPESFAGYAPIGGTPEFLDAVKKAAFKNYEPKYDTKAVATPGGAGALRNAVANYTSLGDKVLTSDWHWAPYNTIAGEIGRSIETFKLFDEKGGFNGSSFENKLTELLKKQDGVLIILNTPAHNPTGYSLTMSDWDCIMTACRRYAERGKRITLLCDVAYIDFAGTGDEQREFFTHFDDLPDNMLVIVAYSLSKTFTLYGLRSGAMIAIASRREVLDEFKKVCEFSSRASWSNSPRAPMEMLAKIYADEILLKKVDDERVLYRQMLAERGKAFEGAALEIGLPILPFDSGFFASVHTDKSEEICAELMEDGIFLVPMKQGIRISIASISKEKCEILPKKIMIAMR